MTTVIPRQTAGHSSLQRAAEEEEWRKEKWIGVEGGGGAEGEGVTDEGNGADKWPQKFSINQQLICCPFKANTT